MSRHDDLKSLKQMCEFASEGAELAANKTWAQVDQNRLLQLSLWKIVELVGESGNRVSKACQERHSNIPWHKIIAMRNRLVHGYDIVNWNVIWEVAVTDLPELAVELKKAVAAESEFKSHGG